MAGKAQNVVALGATLGATAVARKLVDTTWKVGSKGKPPPTDPTDPELDFREALVFAVLLGSAMQIARLLIARRLARGERREKRVASLTA